MGPTLSIRSLTYAREWKSCGAMHGKWPLSWIVIGHPRELVNEKGWEPKDVVEAWEKLEEIAGVGDTGPQLSDFKQWLP